MIKKKIRIEDLNSSLRVIFTRGGEWGAKLRYCPAHVPPKSAEPNGYVTNADMTKRARCWFLVGNTNKEIRSLYFNTYK